ncbi:SWIM zinc finger family protein [Thermomicrobium sp. 4228-Ro]|uniref:SWIM zinc finger family protein n=1 Tax=Thermomicrobium sp. 4228-Ro TaxID=2993937 RepID=UPI0022495C0B|nr:SWIM zinc finger family protein [Thermomicrobium sp. 4228-Ro]MCX2728499.1 SWIM zinc finger family protein [Thermomicrobium sp. 4228-Ro]
MQETQGKPVASWREIDRAIWRRMAERARREGVRAFRLNGDPRHWAVTSASQSGVAYEVTILDDELLCSCPGSAYYRYCKHRALVLSELGLLDPEFGVEAA